MSSRNTPSSSGRFLGVRLTSEEERRLEEFQTARGLASRSDAVRQLLNEAKGTAPTAAIELPPTRQRELETLVEEGFFSSFQAALEHALEAGLAETVRTHADGVPALRRHARDVRNEKDERRRADREGRGLLRR